jgi:transcriptional regulator with XRE-family HTH domain
MARSAKTSRSGGSRRHITPPRTPSEVDHVIAQRLRALRKGTGLSLAELGEQLGLSQQQCQKYETAANRISVGKLINIAEVLNVPPEGLIANLAVGMKPDPELDELKMEGLRLLMSLEQPRKLETVVAMLRGLASDDGPKKSRK